MMHLSRRWPNDVVRVPGARLRAGVLLGAAVLVLAGCFATDPAPRGDAHTAAAYPEVVEGFGRYDKFPPEVAGYRRGRALTYAPGLVDYSVGYNRRDDVVDSAVTLYFYPRMNDTASQLRGEEQEVLQMHRAVRVVSRKTITLMRNGAPYEAHVTSFEYDENFAGTVQPVASQLLVVFRSLGVFKVRSTAPLAQAAIAEDAMLRLLDGVAWDAPEAFVGQ